jgi:prepilin-type processing-associated H-X9-DG protein
VASICAVSISLLVPAVQKARAGAGSKACQNNLKQIAMAALNYHDTFGSFAPGMDDQYVGALIPLLPFVKRDDLYKNFSYDPSYSLFWRNPYNLPPSDGTDDIPRPPDLYGCEGEVDVFLCPDAPQPGDTVDAILVARYGDPGINYRAGDGLSNAHIFGGSPGRLVLARSHYVGIAGELRNQPPFDQYRGIFRYNSQTQLSDITDGAANTIMYAEAWGGYINWGGGGGIPSGWNNSSRSVGFNYSSFGTCPNPTNSSCDYTSSLGLFWGNFGALHGKKANMFNAAMADGSVRSFAGDIDFLLWEQLCGIADGGPRPIGGLRPAEARAAFDP